LERSRSGSLTSGTTVTTTATTVTTTATTVATTATTASGASLTVSRLLGGGLGLVSLEPLGVLGEGGLVVLGLGPEIGGEVSVGLSKGHEDGLDEVLRGSGVTSGGSVAIIDSGELEELLGDGGSNNTGTSGGGDELGSDGTGLTGDLAGNGMDVTDLVSPETSSDGDEGELGGNEGTLDSNLDFLGDLDSETNVTVLVTDGNNSLEAGSLSGLGLLLDGDNLHNLIGEGLAGLLEELVNNRGFLDGDGVSVDFLELGDVSVLH